MLELFAGPLPANSRPPARALRSGRTCGRGAELSRGSRRRSRCAPRHSLGRAPQDPRRAARCRRGHQHADNTPGLSVVAPAAAAAATSGSAYSLVCAWVLEKTIESKPLSIGPARLRASPRTGRHGVPKGPSACRDDAANRVIQPQRYRRGRRGTKPCSKGTNLDTGQRPRHWTGSPRPVFAAGGDE